MSNSIRIFTLSLFGAAVLAAFVPGMSHAQTTANTQSHVDRKLVYKVDPYYPTDLKRLFIGGVVRLKIVVSARGTVDTITPLGGNAAFVENSVAAVKKWKYSPAEAPTEMLINLDFDPRR
jgi:TonB family protein